MHSIKEALKSLTVDKRSLLDYAFENGLSEYVIIANKWFIGVNVEGNPNLIVIETKGLWSFGEVNAS